MSDEEPLSDVYNKYNQTWYTSIITDMQDVLEPCKGCVIPDLSCVDDEPCKTLQDLAGLDQGCPYNVIWVQK